MSETIRDAAIEAAAKAIHQELQGGVTRVAWDELTPTQKAGREAMVTPLVDAVLAVALPEWRKHAFELRKTAIAEARAEALRDAANADARGYYMNDEWERFLRDRADAEEAGK